MFVYRNKHGDDWISPILRNFQLYIYPLVIQRSYRKSPFSICKPSINGPFSTAMLNNQRDPEGIFIYPVGGLEHGFYFPFYTWDNPSHWLSYFSDGYIYHQPVYIYNTVYIYVYIHTYIYISLIILITFIMYTRLPDMFYHHVCSDQFTTYSPYVYHADLKNQAAETRRALGKCLKSCGWYGNL